MRIGFTIILNGEHHLRHNGYAEYLAQHLDYWFIVEGAAGSQGSTAWCKDMPLEYHCAGTSVDSTVEYILELQKKYKNIHLNSTTFGFWPSKDSMCNRALFDIQEFCKVELWRAHGCDIFLWEIDVDEQWNIENMVAAEEYLLECGADCGEFLSDYYVGKNLVAKGAWGEGKKLPYRRLWNWKGQYFKTHEPPELEGGNGKTVLCPQRFKHYAYYFDKDVKFKNDWYSGHEGIYERWQEIQKLPKEAFPIGIDRLITGPWGKTNTQIAWRDQ